MSILSHPQLGLLLDNLSAVPTFAPEESVQMMKQLMTAAALALTVVPVASAQMMDHKAMNKDIVETAVAAGSFKTLTAALQATGLVDVLKGEGPFTVFAPTDEAFAKLPAGTVEALLKDKAKLTAILTYHVVSGDVVAADVVKLTSANTVNGQMVSIMVKDGVVMINNATVMKADVKASNGVIHVIDTVLLPK